MKKYTETLMICGTECEVAFYHSPYRPAVLYPYPGHPEEPEDFEIMELRVNGVDVLDMVDAVSTGGIDHDKIIEAIKEAVNERDD